MIIGSLTLDLDIPGAYSLKDKRVVINRIRERARRFNVAIAEVDDNDVWNRACLGVVTVSNEQKRANQVLSRFVDMVETVRECNLEDAVMEFL